MGTKEEAKRAAGGPHILTAHGGVFKACHDFEAVAGNEVVHAHVSCLIEISGGETCLLVRNALAGLSLGRDWMLRFDSAAPVPVDP